MRTHGLSGAQYRARHGLELTAVLIAGEIRQKMSQAWELHRDEHVANLDRSRNPDRARAQMRPRSQWPAASRVRRSAALSAKRGRLLTDDEMRQLATAAVGAAPEHSTAIVLWGTVVGPFRWCLVYRDSRVVAQQARFGCRRCGRAWCALSVSRVSRRAVARAMAQLRAAAAHPNARNSADVVIAGRRFAVVFAALAVRQSCWCAWCLSSF